MRINKKIGLRTGNRLQKTYYSKVNVRQLYSVLKSQSARGEAKVRPKLSVILPKFFGPTFASP